MQASPETKAKQESKPRIKTVSPDEINLLTPDISDCYHLVELWSKCGRYNSAGMQASPLTWSEVKAFGEFNPITPLEADVIIELSNSFIAGLNDTKSKHPPTFELLNEDEKQEAIRNRVALQFKAIKEKRNQEEA